MKEMLETRIFVTFSFEGWHHWPDAPLEHAYLRDLHRHVFHVRAEKRVYHDDRDIEFIEWKRILRSQVGLEAVQTFPGQSDPNLLRNLSCEQWAKRILLSYGCCRVEVSEDGENGAVVQEAADLPTI